MTAAIRIAVSIAALAAVFGLGAVATPAQASTATPTPSATLTPASISSPSPTVPVDLLLSADGVHFSTTLSAGLFDGLHLLIPRGSTQSALWVRNPTAAPAEVRVSAHDVLLPAGGYADDVTLSAWNSGTGDTLSRTLRGLDRCGIVVSSQPIAAGGTMKLVVTFTMADVSGTVDQGASASLGLLIAMRDADGGPFAASACDDPGTIVPVLPATPATSAPTRSAAAASAGILAHTGVEPPAPVLLVGGLLLGVGIFLLLARRRRSEEDPE
ncbi:LPXTG cell wall anchor domain-containing protein [Cryobacterium sp. GrIS_2_6]|uniref:LPXTG cell wall anchor domain-containing protein n=1 Tax=Cryobacterium sp. GrIS_2_6 TaxID=3162785 RepID=UPI002DF8C34E|nr:LPXTG cell wall anchor domain-containing protein [Cryobacterium psychrotolerans]MEC5152077.1 LPXTG-motif cell wall-anchored protein [Cryobacterium psychrotolerans]